MGYLKLLGLIALALATFTCFAFLVSFWSSKKELDAKDERDEEENCVLAFLREWIRYLLVLTLGFGWGMIALFLHLAATAPEALMHFGWWYLIGFAASVAEMYGTERIFSRRMLQEWDSVASAVVMSLNGPFQVYFAFREIRKYRAQLL